jgi:hypothetical protein
MLDSERLYVDLIFRASKKYASWDPEVLVEVGDWGRITTGKRGWAFWRSARGTFIKEGNIYKDGTAEKYGIPLPKEFGVEATEGVTWVTSQNAEQCDIDVAAGGQTPVFAQCKVNAAFKFSSSYGAILVMDTDTISTIDPPGSLRRLLDDESMRGCVIVSEAHRCSSFARLLTAKDGGSVAIGLSVQPPISGVVSATANANWVRSSQAGNFKSKVNKNGSRDFYPLFRLVSIKEKDTSTGLRGGLDDGDPPLPDAVPPWQTEDDPQESSENPPSRKRFSFFSQ